MHSVLAYIIVSPIVLALRGFVLAQLWLWFVVPQFGVAPLKIPVALGISTIISMLTHHVTSKRQIEEADTLYGLLYSIMSSITALAFGAIYRAFL